MTTIFPSALEYFGTTQFRRQEMDAGPRVPPKICILRLARAQEHFSTELSRKALSPRSELDFGVGARQEIDLQGQAEEVLPGWVARAELEVQRAIYGDRWRSTLTFTHPTRNFQKTSSGTPGFPGPSNEIEIILSTDADKERLLGIQG